MKKKKNRILSVSGAALCLFFPVLLAACSQEDALPRPLEVSAEVGSPATRATDAHAGDYDKSEFVAGDVIRITDGTNTADYQRMVTGTTGTWQPASGQTALTTTGNGSETFTASYPTAFTRILTDQRTATNFWQSNRLTAKGVLDGNKATFSFAPAAAKVTLVVKYGNDSKLPGTASLEGTGIATDAASTSETINAYSASAAGTSAQQHTYVAIVKPGSRTFVIKVKAGDAVSFGQCVVVMEAMKMETEIVAPADGTVASILVKNGDMVETGTALVALN